MNFEFCLKRPQRFHSQRFRSQTWTRSCRSVQGNVGCLSMSRQVEYRALPHEPLFGVDLCMQTRATREHKIDLCMIPMLRLRNILCLARSKLVPVKAQLYS